ncbi:hypothetical protein GCM10020331_033970 [Ectobacillus funiculus]
MFRRNGMGTFSTLTAVGIGIGIGVAASRMMRNGGIQLTDMMSMNKQKSVTAQKQSKSTIIADKLTPFRKRGELVHSRHYRNNS